MANAIQDAILKSIDTMVNNRIDRLEADKTITAQVVQCTNAINGEYRLSYNGGYIVAYAQEGQTYRQNTTVYVLVPMGDFTKKKHIISKAQAIDNDNNVSFISSAMSNYNMIGSNVLKVEFGKDDKSDPKKDYWGFSSYLKDNYRMIYQRGEEPSPDGPSISIDATALNSYIREAEAIMIEASFRTNLPRVHRSAKNGRYGLSFTLAFKDRDKTNEDGTPVIKYYSYVLDSDNMTGNPFLYQNWNDQYIILPIDTENFLYIDSILFFGNGFVDRDDPANAVDNIWVKDLEFYGLKEISAVNGDYKLTLSTPSGAVFKSTSKEDKLNAVAKLTKKDDNLSDATTFYWFAEDGRITPDSEDYQMYGGAGWRRLKDKGSSYNFITSGFENKAYENKYLCVAVYQESMVLKTYFTIYNESCRRDITITSSLGEKFSFDRGTPELTCLIDGRAVDFDKKIDNADINKQNRPDSYFSFYWTKIDDTGQSLLFNQTLEELQKQYDAIIADTENTQKASELLALRDKMNQIEGATFTPGKNTLSYPVRNINGNARFKCSVYLKDTETAEPYAIGSAEILLVNADAAIPTDYYIVIENGDQVFQYSESGVAPDSERYTEEERLKIKPLTVHFYDPAGLEVNPKTYNWKFIVPIQDSLINPPETLSINPANNKYEVYTGDTYPTAIKQNYDFQALNNQIKVVASYEGQEYSQLTTFLFAKVGENGTNGTDLVAKIDPIDAPQDCLLAMVLNDGEHMGYNNGKGKDEKVLEYKLFARNEPVNLGNSTILWKVNGYGGTRSRFLNPSENSNSGITAPMIFRTGSWSKSPSTGATYSYEQMIMQAYTTYENNTLYANYAMPIINYNFGGYELKFDRDYCLRNILYNADGRNPLYNKNQGVSIKILHNGVDISQSVTITYTAEGGENGTQPDFGLSYEKNPKTENVRTSIPARHSFEVDKVDSAGKPVMGEDGKPIQEIKTENATMVYITPNDVFNGAYTNNNVRIEVKSGSNLILTALLPIYMSLNTYGLKSLNAWDGNTLQINEEENYILAPQIGAGEKNNRNQFTGVVMGVSEYYDQDKNKTTKQNGLLGYSNGEQSIFLDAATGSATFGLPENDTRFNEGRIELIPGGTSKIGNWKIASRSLYNVDVPDNSKETGLVRPDSTYTRVPSGTPQVIQHDRQGIMLSADPSFMSIKTAALDSSSGISFGDANTVVNPGDSLEIELNPHIASAFTIYRHIYNSNTKSYTGRTPLVGINSNGQFYTNAIENGESTMGIGAIGAFGANAAQGKYAGAQFAYKNNNIFKFFVPVSGGIGDKLFISAGTETDNEYVRPISIHGQKINLYSSAGKATGESTDFLISLGGSTSESLLMGYKNNNYFDMSFSNGGTTKLQMFNNFEVKQTNLQKNATLIFGPTTLNTQKFIEKNNGAKSTEVTGTYSISTTDNYKVDRKKNGTVVSNINLTDSQAILKTSNSSLTLGTSTGTSTLTSSGTLNINATGADASINIYAQNTASGVKVKARFNNNENGQSMLHLIPGSRTSAGTFHLSSVCGEIFSNMTTINGQPNQKYISTTGLIPSWIYLLGNASVPGDSGVGLKVQNNLRAKNFFYITDGTGTWTIDGKESTFSNKDIWKHIEKLYSLITTISTYAKGLNNSMKTYVDTTLTIPWNRITGKPSTFKPTNHSHNITIKKEKTVYIPTMSAAGAAFNAVHTSLSDTLAGKPNLVTLSNFASIITSPFNDISNIEVGGIKSS